MNLALLVMMQARFFNKIVFYRLGSLLVTRYNARQIIGFIILTITIRKSSRSEIERYTSSHDHFHEYHF